MSKRFFSLVVALVVLSACTGGGGDAPTTPVVTPVVPTTPVIVGAVPATTPIAVGAAPDTVLATTTALVIDVSTLPTNTLIPDVGFEQALIDAGLDDVISGSVLTSKVTNVDKLVISKNYGIVNLTGIENFVSLKSLQVEHNALASVDLSKNVALTWVSFWDNKLTSLDVSKLVNLDLLGTGDNLITSLDLTNNTILREIDLQNKDVLPNGGLTTLNLSKNVYLERVYLHYNSLTSVDVSANSKLTDFWATYNKLTTLDFTNNHLLNVIVVNNNSLTYLNAKNTANAGVPRTMRTDINPSLTTILVNDPVAIQTYINLIDANAGGVSTWYMHDVQSIYSN